MELNKKQIARLAAAGFLFKGWEYSSISCSRYYHFEFNGRHVVARVSDHDRGLGAKLNHEDPIVDVRIRPKQAGTEKVVRALLNWAKDEVSGAAAAAERRARIEGLKMTLKTLREAFQKRVQQGNLEKAKRIEEHIMSIEKQIENLTKM
ncbi:MAG: hypothetical protein N3J91_06980 [Verrucomicrobiae bacterium]|nr:hypothetical protein [Verrucomicrobiae bacterium]